ncbi:8395_t:CDS:1, partial [Dentiscutata erythropus]
YIVFVVMGLRSCWHKDPSERLKSKIIIERLGKWILEDSLMFLNAGQEDFQLSELSSDEPIYPEASLT